MKKKNERKKIVEQYKLEHPPTYTEGHWEDAMLENDSYYDIDILENHNAPIREEIRYWEEEYKPSSNMGKWWASIQIERLKKKLKHYKK